MERKDYPSGAVFLHFVIALSIFFLFISSWWMLGLPMPSREFRFREFPFQLHKNIGITLVAITLILIYLRLRNRPSPLPSQDLPAWARRLPAADHVLLYVTIFACCVSGYLSSSYSGWGTTLWWLVELPNWGYENEELNILYSDIHLWTCWLLLALMAVHIAGALYHAFRRDGIIRRMLHL